MKPILLVVIAVTLASASYGQVYSARRLTQRIQPRQAPQQANRTQPAPPPQAPDPSQTTTPPQLPAAAPVYQPQYRAAAPAAPVVPVDPAKAAAEKAKNDEKQFEFFKRRAEEGSDHAQYELGLRYIAGRGVAADEKLGREWLEKASKNGNPQATKKLAELGGETKAGPVRSTAIDNKSVEPKTSDHK